MGNSLWNTVFCRKEEEARILIIGLDAAGKTTVLYKIKLGKVVTTIPTIGFNVETIAHKNISIVAWDVGSRDKMRPLWRHYYPNTDVLVVVVDSTDMERIEEVKELLHSTLEEDELRDVLLLMLANKQDLSNAASLTTLQEKLGINKIKHINHMVGTAATTGEGLGEALDWLTHAIIRKRAGTLEDWDGRLPEEAEGAAGAGGRSYWAKAWEVATRLITR